MVFHFFIGKLERAIFGPPGEMQVANYIVNFALKRGFRTFCNHKFRTAVHFFQLSTVEQDRMFNELVASNLVLVLLMIDTLAKLANKEARDFLRSLCNVIPAQFVKKLRENGIAEEHAQVWIKLLDLRRDEYEEQRLKARDALPEFGEGNPWLRVVTVGCLFHIRRGKPPTDDPLFILLMEESVAVSATTRRTILRAIRRL